MKKLFLLFIGLSLIISCDKKEEPEEVKVTNNDLVGSWKVTEIRSDKGKISGKISYSGFSTNISSDLSLKGKDYNMVITFANNPKKVSSKGGFTATISVKIPVLGKEESYTQKIPSIPASNGNWNVENNVLTTKSNGETVSIDIASFNKSEIEFSYPLSTNFKGILGNLSKTGVKDGKIEGNLIVKAKKQ